MEATPLLVIGDRLHDKDVDHSIQQLLLLLMFVGKEVLLQIVVPALDEVVGVNPSVGWVGPIVKHSALSIGLMPEKIRVQKCN